MYSEGATGVGWVRLKGGGGEEGRGIGQVGGGVGRPAGKNLQILDFHRLASFIIRFFRCKHSLKKFSRSLNLFLVAMENLRA